MHDATSCDPSDATITLHCFFISSSLPCLLISFVFSPFHWLHECLLWYRTPFRQQDPAPLPLTPLALLPKPLALKPQPIALVA